MPPDPSQPPQRAWRGALPSAGGGPAKGGPAWKGGSAPAAAARKPWSRKTKLAFGVGLLGALAGLFVVVALLLRPPPPFRLVLVSAGYETNLAVPHNVPGRKAVAKLEAWAKDHPKVEVAPAALTADLKALDKALAGCKSPTVVLFLAAHGAADEDGPYLFPEDFDRPDARKVRLAQILDRLDRLPAGTKKLLILDATQVDAAWPLGLFHNDFARKLKEQLAARVEKSPGLVVLSASDEGERSWVSEEWRQSIFAHHVHEGLRGAAESGGRVTAHDLHQYVLKKVQHWARQNREALQTPVLLGGEGRARGLELVALEQPYQAPDPARLEPFRAPPELGKAWDACDVLARQTPSPAAYTPHLWAQYLETLLRYEQLLRADDPAAADRLHGRLAPLHEQIVKARSRKLDSALGTLTMPAALGWASPASVAQPGAKEVQELWEKDAEAARADLGKLLAAEGDSWRKRLLRVRLAGLLLRQAEADPPRGLKRARALLAALDEGRDPRPAEAQSLVLLERDRIKQPPEPLWGAVKNALQVRRLAEEAAVGLKADKASADLPAYSEQVQPWIRAAVTKGDESRRPGQDLLLASGPADWKEADKLLGEARGHYQEAQELALRVRAALQQRDEALVALPYYSQFLARKRLLEPAEIRGFEDKVQLHRELWDSVRKVEDLLRQPDPKAAAELAAQTEAVRKGLKDLRDEVRDLARNKKHVLQPGWHEIDNLLRIPFIAPRERQDLLKQLRAISAQLNVEVKQAGGKRDPGAQQARELSRQSGSAHAKLALAALGEEVFKSVQEGPLDFTRALEQARVPLEERWQAGLGNAGRALAQRLSLLPQAIAKKLEAAAKQQPDKAVALARDAAALSRRLPGAAAAWLGNLDPVAEQRRLQLYDLLCWQGERTSLDFLAGDSKKAPLYYQDLGRVYAREARAQLAGESATKLALARLGRVERLGEELADEKRIPEVRWSLDRETFDTPRTLALTDEQILPLWYGLRAAPTVPPGRPVLWRSYTGEAKFLERPDKSRSALPEVGADPGKASLAYPLVRQREHKPEPVPEAVDQVVHGRYRGHVLEGTLRITSYALPDTTAALPAMPETGKLAVQATEEVFRKYAWGRGAVVLILDCSGSMKGKRFEEAKRALLNVLAGIPEGTQVSIWAFSHRYSIRIPKGQPGHDMSNFEPENTIEKVFPLKAASEQAAARKWKWSEAAFKLIKDRLNNLEVCNYTPIVRSMMTARQDFKDGHAFKTMVVLTDGMDNGFERQPANAVERPGWPGDPDYNRGGDRKIPDFLQEQFGKSDIDIRIIGFQLPTKEQAEFERQFEAPLAKLRKPGKVYQVGDTPALLKALRDSVPQRLYFSLFDPDGYLVKGWQAGDVSLQGDPSHWARNLRPGIYKIVMHGKKPLEQRVDILRGLRLRLNLSERDGEFVLERDRVRQSFPGATFHDEQPAKGWLLTVLQNHRLPDKDALQMTIAAEKLAASKFTGRDLISHVIPRVILFQVKPAPGATAPPTLRYYPLADYTAPAWGLDIEPWPRKAAPEVEAFWSEDKRDPDGELRRDRNFNDKLEVIAKAATARVRLDNGESGEVRLLSLTTEPHAVKTADGGEKTVPCLVVRLAFPKGKAVMVQPQRSVGGSTAYTDAYSGGQEHRFYTRAGKYTGIFWEITPQQALQELQGLHLISLDRLREEATRITGLNATFKRLKGPENDPRPSPPQ
jgi:hypothetical protein